MLHVMKDNYPLSIGDDVTVGHGVMLHGCTIESRVLVGMGAILLNSVRMGTGSIIAAGTLVAGAHRGAAGQPVHGAPGQISPRADAGGY